MPPMHMIDLAYVGRGIHEELVAYVADQEGYFEDEGVHVAVRASFLGRLTRDEVQRYYERYIGPYFTSDGRVDLNVAQHAVHAVSTELGVAAASVDQMYQPAL